MRSSKKTSRRRVAVAEGGGRRVVIPRGTLGRQAAAVGGTGLSLGAGRQLAGHSRAGESAQEAAMTAGGRAAHGGAWERLRGGDDRAEHPRDTQESAARVLPAGSRAAGAADRRAWGSCPPAEPRGGGELGAYFHCDGAPGGLSRCNLIIL